MNKLIVATLPAIPKPIVRRIADRYIAGEDINDAIRVVKKLNAEGIMATLDVLGEDIHQREEAITARDRIIEALHSISKERLDSNVSIKLTQFGLKLDKQFCFDNTSHILAVARDLGNFIRVDMEDSTCTSDTLWIYRELRKNFKIGRASCRERV